MINFGNIKTNFNELLVEGITQKNDKKKAEFSKYLKVLKENKILRTQFFIYDNIENKCEPKEYLALQFLDENLNLLSKFNKSDIISENEKLGRLLKGKEIDYSKKKLHECLNKLITTKKSGKNIDELLEAKNYVIDYMVKNTVKESVIDGGYVPTSLMTSIMVDNYNEKYSELSENEKKVVKALIDNSGKEEVLKSLINEVLTMVDDRYDKEDDLELKNVLLKTKHKVLNETHTFSSDEEFINKVSNIMNFKNTLEGN
jgi:hypothetical protein